MVVNSFYNHTGSCLLHVKDEQEKWVQCFRYFKGVIRYEGYWDGGYWEGGSFFYIIISLKWFITLLREFSI
jgi:hypothetical protein